MRFGKLVAFVSALSIVATLAATKVEAAETLLIGLTDGNTLVRFNSVQPALAKPIQVTDVSGTLIGIDFRPANGLLYGLSDENILYTIDLDTGKATQVSILSAPFTGGINSGVDFNPAADRLRLVAGNDQNFRVNVDTGAVADEGDGIPGDRNLAYATTDINTGKDPNITAAGYTNSVAGATTTRLYNIDTTLDTLVIQDPPNNGTLFTVGALGVDFGPRTGFDIFVDRNGVNYGFAVSNSVLYAIDLAIGKATPVGVVGTGRFTFFGLVALRSS